MTPTPDQESAIKKAIEEFKVPANQHDRLIAQRRVDCDQARPF
jgi:hypothetical protein